MKLSSTILFTMVTSIAIFGQTLQKIPSANLKNSKKKLEAQEVQKTNPTNSNSTPYRGSGLHNCKSHELNEKHYQERGILNEFNQSYLQGTAKPKVPDAAKTPGVNTIPIIFHVVYNPNTPAENVSNALIMQVYNDIVQDFQLLNADAANARAAFGFVPADANINFCLATKTPTGTPLTEVGVERVSTTEAWYDSNNGEENKMKASATGGAQIWDRNKYLNVWICDISNGANSGTAGYAYRPTSSYLPGSDIDGIVIDYNLGVNNDNVLTHEIGHYLGLDHTWGGSGSCSMDDGFTDTPNTAGPSFNYAGSCSGNQSTCSGVQTQYENYMDYSNCTVMFTQNQANYMLSILTGIRGSLLLSNACDPVNAPPVADFNANIGSPIIIPVGGALTFNDLSSNAPTSWSWNFGGGATNSTVQNPTVTFNTLGTYTVTLTATNTYGSDSEVKTGYVQVVAAAAGSACDTLRNYNPVTENYAAYSLLAPSIGTIPGTCTIGGQNVTKYADRYVAPTSTKVRRLILPIFTAYNGSGSGMMKIRVVNDNAGSPGTTVAALDTFLIADMQEGYFNTFDFTNPGTVTGAFWVEFELFYGTQDTIVIGMVNFTDRGAGANTMKLYHAAAWKTPATLFGAGYNSSLWLDVLTSNGAAPSADFTLSDNALCAGGMVSANGSTSTNATHYDWYLTNGTGSTVISNPSGASQTFNFPTAGSYRIYLFADGACLTDGIYAPITVNAKPTATVNSTNTTCGNNNGTISITGATGGNSPYSYSIDGSNFQSGTAFANLAAGTYTVYVKTAGSACQSTYSKTIATSTPFTATISANQFICPGQSATLTAGGGTSYAWFDGSTNIGTTASISVSPAATTQYSCQVTDASGCISTVFTNVAVDCSLSLQEALANGLKIYPVPAKDIVNVEFNGAFNYELRDARGRLIQSGNAVDVLKLQLAGQESGMYFIQLSNDSFEGTFRLVKQ